MLDHALNKVDMAFVPFLKNALDWVHEKKEQIGMAVKCPECGKEYEKEQGLKIHMGRIHKVNGGAEAPSPVAQVAQESAVTPDSSVANAPAQPSPKPEDLKMLLPPLTADTQLAQSPVQPVALQAPAPPVEPKAPEAVPPFAPPAAPPPAVGKPTSVTMGSVVMLHGPTWWQNSVNGKWEPVMADKLEAQVVSKELTEAQETTLICRAQGGASLWAVAEKAVLEGQVRLVKLAPAKDTDFDGFRPPDTLKEIKEPEYDYFAEKKRAEQEAKELQRSEDRETLEPSLRRYVEARSAKKTAEKAFEEVNKAERPTLWSFVEKYGTETEAGKNDQHVIEFGQKLHIVRTPGAAGVKRDTAKIIEWLLNSDMTECLDYALNLVKWDEAKKARKIPAEFIQEVEVPFKEEDRLALRVDPL